MFLIVDFLCFVLLVFFFFKQKTAYEMRISDWSSDVCSSDLLIHVNINYRYVAEEVFYIFDDSDSEVIVYSSEFRDCIVELKDRLEKVHTFVEIGEASQIAPFAIPYETLAQEGDGSALGIVRSPEDQLFIYTGGTTGMPKGVMWHPAQLRKTKKQEK